MKIDDLLKNNNEIELIDLKQIIKYYLGVDDSYLITHKNEIISSETANKILEALEQITKGTPLQYITNTQYFMGLKFYVDKNVLIPQPDTELIVEDSIDIIKKMFEKKKRTLKVLDLCTGSGAIAISIKYYCKDIVDITASDISKEAIQVAKTNERNILKDESIKFVLSDMFENIKDKYDLVISNPPYIKKEDICKLNTEVRNEPNIALDGGNDGLKFYRIIKDNINNILNVNGYLIMEIGYDQKQSVMNLFENSVCKKDLSNNDREIKWIREEC